MSVLAKIPLLGLLAAHPGSHTDPDRKLRARPAADDARTDGPPRPPATGAGRYPPGGPLLDDEGLAWVRDLNERLASGHYTPRWRGTGTDREAAS